MFLVKYKNKLDLDQIEDFKILVSYASKLDGGCILLDLDIADQNFETKSGQTLLKLKLRLET